MEENKKEVIRKAKRKHMKKKRAEPEHVQPRVYVKPPQSQKVQRVSRAEKKEIEMLPMLDTEAERARVADMLERARANRVELPFSRWS
jgi:fructose-1,6-bisphosphatase/sedoheptulose 1,7-bisphosphatase-like protein